MEASWVISENYTNSAAEAKALESIGTTWGSWKTWRSYNTNNVLCADNAKSKDLIKRAFHGICNFYIPQKSFIELNRPKGVRVFEGDFPDDFPCQEDVIALHLCSHSEIVLCLGFDLKEIIATNTKQKFLAKSYEAAVRAVIKNNPNTQFVFVDHPDELDKSFSILENISCDTYENVLNYWHNV